MTKELLDFYHEVLVKEASETYCFNVKVDLENIRTAYRQTSRDRKNVLIDYNEAGKRYAYIYYYAVCHTMAVIRLLMNVRENFITVFVNMMQYHKKLITICSLGGGPGSDLIGLLRVRAEYLGTTFTKKFRCYVIDISIGWEKSLRNVMDTYLKSPNGSVYKGKLKYRLLRSDLRECIGLPVMIKNSKCRHSTFGEICICFTSLKMVSILKTIFNILKPGAFVIFLDNSTGGVCKIVEEASNQAGLLLAFPIIQRKIKLSMETWCIGPLALGVRPLKQTSVCFSIWQKKV